MYEEALRSFSGTASSRLEDLSTIINMYLKPSGQLSHKINVWMMEARFRNRDRGDG
jgi:hypothetical protein